MTSISKDDLQRIADEYEFVVGRIDSYMRVIHMYWGRLQCTVTEFWLENDGRVGVRYIDYEGDNSTEHIPAHVDLWSPPDNELVDFLKQVKADHEAEEKRKQAEYEAAQKKLLDDARKRAEKANQRERDKIFREEAEKRGIKL